jgi:hypothetical protein
VRVPSRAIVEATFSPIAFEEPSGGGNGPDELRCVRVMLWSERRCGPVLDWCFF